MSISERWQQRDDSLVADIECDDFMAAVELINQIAELAEQQNHHPDVWLHGYKNLQIILQTHDEGGLSSKDEQLAQAIDELWE